MLAPARLLVDAGPLVALFNRRDNWHRQARDFFGAFHGTLVTTWPVLAEAAHFIVPRTPALLDLVDAKRIEIVEVPGSAARVAALMRTYSDLPMDLADATLVAAAERVDLSEILTLDRHFHVYRLGVRGAFTVWSLEMLGS